MAAGDIIFSRWEVSIPSLKGGVPAVQKSKFLYLRSKTGLDQDGGGAPGKVLGSVEFSQKLAAKNGREHVGADHPAILHACHRFCGRQYHLPMMGRVLQ